MTRLGRAIKEYREKGGLSLREFERLTGFNAQYASEIERGIKIPIKLEALRKLARALDMNINGLVMSAHMDREDKVCSRLNKGGE